MKEHLSTEPYKGVRDFYPEDWARMQDIFQTARKTLTLRGFSEYNASPLERAELYESKTSEEIVNEQTYTFTDRGERRVTLRPEMTPTLARMVAGKRRELVYPLRWFSIGNRFRYERPQKGREREFYQIDVDIVGFSGAQAEGEAVVTAYELLRAYGAKNADFRIKINSRALLDAACEALGLSKDEVTAYCAVLDRKDKMPADVFETARAPYRRNGTDPLELIEADAHEAVIEEREKLAGLLHAFKERGMDNVVFDPTVVRGFLYYTGIVFEVYDTNAENPRALLGGGRYDGLVSLFGGEELPAVGFAVGVTTLLDFLETHKLHKNSASAPTVYVGVPDEDDMALAQAFAETLRKEGVASMVASGTKGLGDQVKEAVRRGIPFFIAFGKEEQKKKKVRVKELTKSKEKEVKVKDAPSYIARH